MDSSGKERRRTARGYATRGAFARWQLATQERSVKYLTLVAVAACTLAAGCASYTERTVVQKPVPAQTTVYSTAPAPTTTTTSVSVN